MEQFRIEQLNTLQNDLTENGVAVDIKGERYEELQNNLQGMSLPDLLGRLDNWEVLDFHANLPHSGKYLTARLYVSTDDYNRRRITFTGMGEFDVEEPAAEAAYSIFRSAVEGYGCTLKALNPDFIPDTLNPRTDSTSPGLINSGRGISLPSPRKKEILRQMHYGPSSLVENLHRWEVVEYVKGGEAGARVYVKESLSGEKKPTYWAYGFISNKGADDPRYDLIADKFADKIAALRLEGYKAETVFFTKGAEDDIKNLVLSVSYSNEEKIGLLTSMLSDVLAMTPNGAAISIYDHRYQLKAGLGSEVEADGIVMFEQGQMPVIQEEQRAQLAMLQKFAEKLINDVPFGGRVKIAL